MFNLFMVQSSTNKKTRPKSVETIDFGSRKICNQNKSKVIAIPKLALANLNSSSSKVKVELVQERGKRFLKLTPTKGGKN